MRKETRVFNVYTVNELSKKALDKAYSNWLDVDYYDGSDNESVLSKFEEIFPIRVGEFEYGNRNFIKFYYYGVDDISGHRLAKFIWNNFKDYLFKGKYYSKGHYDKEGKYINTSRRSKLILETDCTLTGYYIDNYILEPIYTFLKSPRDITLEELMKECLDKWIEGCDSDYQDHKSFEYFIEEAQSNEWEYLEDGKKFF